MQARRQVDT
ncbi:hypothetical protein E2C01_097852 [Portunus trituberculatus]|uniref:Uncharacterized protein n=1 Tax=Portunus trituberculatus TaxID=210409 RepID=A0A5B7KAL7_PORTR|nr:hypothetical protein [Portunus trituberculatus]